MKASQSPLHKYIEACCNVNSIRTGFQLVTFSCKRTRLYNDLKYDMYLTFCVRA